MDDIVLKTMKAPNTSLGITPKAHGGGFPAACLTTSVNKIGGITETTVLVNLANGAGSGGSADDVIGTDGVTDAGGAYIADLDDDINGVLFAVKFSCIEVPTGGDHDIDLVFSATGTDVHDAAVTSGTKLLNNGDLTLGESATTAAGATITAGGTNALNFVYLTSGDATNAAYTAGKIAITFYGANF